MADPARRVRDLAALMVGSMLVHQLHYALGHGAGAGSGGSHAYLPLLAMAAGLAVVTAGGCFVRSLRAARASGAIDVTPSPYVVRWLTLAATLVTVFVVQEAVEAAFVGGPAAALSLPGHGIVNAVLLSVAVAAVLALVLTGADAVLTAAGRSRRGMHAAGTASWSRHLAVLATRNVLSRNLAGRAPPLGI